MYYRDTLNNNLFFKYGKHLRNCYVMELNALLKQICLKKYREGFITVLRYLRLTSNWQALETVPLKTRLCKHHTNLCLTEHQFKAVQVSPNCTAVHRVANMKNVTVPVAVTVIQYNSNIIFKFSSFYTSIAHIFPLQSLMSFISIMWVSVLLFLLLKLPIQKNEFKKVICYLLGFIFSPQKTEIFKTGFSVYHTTYLNNAGFYTLI